MGGPTIQDEAEGGATPLAGGRGRECPRCRHANPPVARYCGNCGAELAGGGGPFDFARGGPFELARGELAALMCRGDQLAAEGGRLFEDARRAYLAAARAAPDRAAPLLALGRLCRANGRRTLAKSYYREAVRRAPSCWQGWAEAADCCGVVQDFRRAWWLGRALRAGGQPAGSGGQGSQGSQGSQATASGAGPGGPPESIDPQVRRRFIEHYGKLRRWEKWLIRATTGQPA